MRPLARSLALAMVLSVGLGGPIMAQEAALNVPPPILTIDQDRLFTETRVGAEATSQLEADAAALARENAEIEAGLIERERQLTERRPTLPPEEFRALADAFDADVQRVRGEQDEKARALNRAREAARQSFFSGIGSIISDIVRERGALVVLDRRDVFLSADRIDITDEAIARINAQAEPATPEN